MTTERARAACELRSAINRTVGYLSGVTALGHLRYTRELAEDTVLGLPAVRTLGRRSLWTHSDDGGLLDLSAPAKALPRADDYDSIRADLEDALFEAFIGYASSGGRVTSYRNAAGRALLEAVSDAFYRGYADAGGEETEGDDEAWLTAQQQAQLGHLPGVFEWIKEQREAETITEDAVRARVEGWLSALDGIYAEGKLRGKDNVMLTFDGDDGEESCAECQKYKGQRHSAKWWLKRDLVRRNGNENYTCGRWEYCHHGFYTDDGELYAD